MQKDIILIEWILKNIKIKIMKFLRNIWKFKTKILIMFKQTKTN